MSTAKKIFLHDPPIGEDERKAVFSVLQSGKVKGGGKYDKRCSEFLKSSFHADNVLMTSSCTHALEIACLLLKIDDGDEVIVPSFTFSSTAAAFALHGAEIKFCDINKRTLNLSTSHLEEIVSRNTSAIVPVHYAGVSCNMDEICRISNDYNTPIIEDAAQGVNSKYNGEYLGNIGDIGCYSFQGTKSYVAGEGGAIIIEDDDLFRRAEHIRQKGTNYADMRRGDVDRYTWVDIGSSYIPSELQMALLYPQLKRKDRIKDKRNKNHNHYMNKLSFLEECGDISLPHIPNSCEPNYHLFYIRTNNEKDRDELLHALNKENIEAKRHYEPLHTSKMGKSFGYSGGDLPRTEEVSRTLLRLPVHTGLGESELKKITDTIRAFFTSSATNDM